MTRPPAIRLMVESASADVTGVDTIPQNRQIVLDAEAVIELRREIGSDLYLTLETLFLLAHPTPSGIYVYGGASRIAEVMQWGRDKTRRCLSKLAELGYIERTQEAETTPGARPRFGRGVIKLDTSATVTPNEIADQEPEKRDDFSVWGSILSADTCHRVLSAWGVSDADKLIRLHSPARVSDGIKLVAFNLQSGTPINNPGAYVRRVINDGRVAAPGPHVPRDFLEETVTAADLLALDPTQRTTMLQQSRAARERRQKDLANLFATLHEDVRAEIELRVDDAMRAFRHHSPEVQEIKEYNLLEEALAERGVLAELPTPESSSPADEDPPF